MAVVCELIGEMTELKQMLKDNIISSLDSDAAERLEGILTEIAKQQTEMLEIHKKKIRDEISPEEYDNKAKLIATVIEQLNKEKTSLETQAVSTRMSNKRVEDILEFLGEIDPTATFDADLFRALVENVLIRQNNEIEFNFKVGIRRSYKLKSRK